MEHNITMPAAAVEEQTCPRCHTMVPIDIGYMPWCDQCGWNLSTHAPDKPQGVFASMYLALGRRSGQALYNKVVKADAIKPRLTLSKALVFVIAALVHLITLAFFIVGLGVIIGGWPKPLLILGGAVCLLIAAGLRPRLPKPHGTILLREEAPTLYQVADGVAQVLGASHIDAIVIDRNFNAAFGKFGWRRKSVLYLGLPLISILECQELVALIGHELAHSVNGDSSRGLFVGSAIESLRTWHDALRPTRIYISRSMFGFFATLLSIALLVLSFIPRMVAYVLIHLLWHDSQRAEYLADQLAASIGGTAAAVSLSEKMRLHHTFSETVRRIRFVQTNQNVIDELRRRVAQMPPRERERIKRIEQQHGSYLNAHHPPPTLRTAFLKTRALNEPKVALTPAGLDQIQRELAPHGARIQDELIGGY